MLFELHCLVILVVNQPFKTWFGGSGNVNIGSKRRKKVDSLKDRAKGQSVEKTWFSGSREAWFTGSREPWLRRRKIRIQLFT